MDVVGGFDGDIWSILKCGGEIGGERGWLEEKGLESGMAGHRRRPAPPAKGGPGLSCIRQRRRDKSSSSRSFNNLISSNYVVNLLI